MKKILIIEDDQKIALALSIRLKAHGYAAWIASDGIMALKMAAYNKPDLILLDVSLPAGNGFGLAERFQHLPEIRDTPIIFVTANKDLDLRQKAMELGAAGLVRKPYDAEELLTIATNVLGQSEASRFIGFEPDPENDSPGPAKPPTKKILIIEDAPPAAAALDIRLRANGYATWIASDAVMGLSLAISNQPDLILLDIALPGGDGFALAKKLQHLAETQRTPIIFITGSRDPKLREKVMNLGAAGLLEKPYDAEELLATIKLALGRQGRPPHAESVGPRRDDVPSRAAQALKRILIIEDDQKIAMSLAVRLKAAGYDATMAPDGVSGIRSAVDGKPDLVLLDISLPAGDGFTVAERIQTNIPTPTPIIFLTASKRSEFRQRAHELGAVGFFEKPFEVQELLAAIQKSLAAPGQVSEASW